MSREADSVVQPDASPGVQMSLLPRVARSDDPREPPWIAELAPDLIRGPG